MLSFNCAPSFSFQVCSLKMKPKTPISARPRRQAHKLVPVEVWEDIATKCEDRQVQKSGVMFGVFYCDQKGKGKERVCRRTGDRRQEGSKLLQTGEQDRGNRGSIYARNRMSRKG